MADILSDALDGISLLPSEMLVEILERVDVVHSLLQSRLVSKLWLSSSSVHIEMRLYMFYSTLFIDICCPRQRVRSVPRVNFLFTSETLPSVRRLVKIFPNMNTLFMELDLIDSDAGT
jgi:hypothetical protein